MTKLEQELQMPLNESELTSWCRELKEMCQKEGEVYPPDFHSGSKLYLGGTFIINLRGKRLFFEIDDYGWEAYDYDRDESEEPYGYNLLINTVVDLDKAEIIVKQAETEHAEDDMFQGFAQLIGRLVTNHVTYPEGDWELVLAEIQDFGLLDE